MIFGRRIEITGTLTLSSDMHIGVSDTGRDSEEHELALVARGVGGAPIIPASSLKGVLRAGLSAHDANAIFGDPSEHREGEGHAARLWLDHAWLATHPENLSGLSKEPTGGGVFQATHVALDPATGAAEEHKLFSREMVAAGATFSFRADWFPAEGDDITTLAPVFAMLRDGVQMGRGATKGHGRVELDTTTLSLQEYLPKDGALDRQNQDVCDFYEAIEKIGDTARPTRRITLTLAAEGPFLSVREIGGPNRRNEMQPLEQDGKPVLWPESLAGALRARARWLAALDGANGDHKDAPSTRRSREDLANDKLSDVERLFGVTGRKGALTVRSVVCVTPGEVVHLQNNSIDRFTGGTRDEALYGKCAFWQPCFHAVLEIEGEHELLNTLLEDLKKEGETLELGHGASTGFGWFMVEVADDGT